MMMCELRRLRDAAPGTAELRRARNYVVGQIDLCLESTDNQMNWLGEQLLGYSKTLPLAHIKQRLIEPVRHFDLPPAAFAAQSPVTRLEAVAVALFNFQELTWPPLQAVA